MSFWDALRWATAKLNDVAIILTEDMHDGRIVEGVRIVNPQVDGFDLDLLCA